MPTYLVAIVVECRRADGTIAQECSHVHMVVGDTLIGNGARYVRQMLRKYGQDAIEAVPCALTPVSALVAARPALLSGKWTAGLPRYVRLIVQAEGQRYRTLYLQGADGKPYQWHYRLEGRYWMLTTHDNCRRTLETTWAASVPRIRLLAQNYGLRVNVS